MRILHVEDHPMNRDMLSRRLRRRGHEVVDAVDGGQAVALAPQVGPHLIIMDIGLPDFDGHEATRQIRAMPGLDRVPIVILTAFATDFDRQLAAANGANAFLTKPVDFEELCRVLDRLVAVAPATP